jgi:hypothetical protein
VLRKSAVTIEKLLQSEDRAVEVVPFRRGKLTWGAEWR